MWTLIVQKVFIVLLNCSYMYIVDINITVTCITRYIRRNRKNTMVKWFLLLLDGPCLTR